MEMKIKVENNKRNMEHAILHSRRPAGITRRKDNTSRGMVITSELKQ